MLKFDINSLMESREVQNPLNFMVKAGFNYHTARRLLNNETTHISNRHLEKLCLELNCTPDDLYTWVPGKSTKATGKIALSKLTNRNRKGSILPKVKTLPQEKLDELRKYIDKLAEE